MQHRALGSSGLRVSALGLGLMGMSEFYGARDEASSLATLEAAAEAGISFLDTADTYGFGHNEELLGRFLRGRARDAFVVATKFGIVRHPGAYERRIDGSPAYVRSACEASLRRLGVEAIDLYYAHRLEPGRPVEETVGAMADLVREGKVRALGLSEVSATTLRRAAAVHPIAAVQSEYSLWTRFVEDEVRPACGEVGAALVAYSPLGRGFLTGAITAADDLPEGDFRRALPRFGSVNLAANLALAEGVKAVAAAKGATPAQVALAWLLAQGPEVVPIPGTKRVGYLRDNLGALNVTLTADDLAALDAAFPKDAAVGERYPAGGWVGIDEGSGRT